MDTFTVDLPINVEGPVHGMVDLELVLTVQIGWEYEPADPSVGLKEGVYWAVRESWISYPKAKKPVKFDANSIHYLVACWLEEHSDMDQLVWKEVRKKQEEAEAINSQYDD